MSLIVVVVCALLGFFAGAAAWIVARNQATGRLLWGPPRCEVGFGVSISPKAKPANPPEGAEPAPEPATTSATTAGCGAPLPIAAWLPLYGFGTAWRCPTCDTPQSPWRVAVEVLTAIYFAIAASRIDDGVHLVAVLVFTLPLLVIFLVDTWTRLIYTNVIYVGTAAGLVFALLDDGLDGLFRSTVAVVAAVAVFAFFYFVAMAIYRNVRVVPFGKGDVYLAAMIGAMVRIGDLLPALFFGIVLAALGGLLLMAVKRVGRRQAMPYGPFLCLGALIALL